jgi:hypothetical protein
MGMPTLVSMQDVKFRVPELPIWFLETDTVIMAKGERQQNVEERLAQRKEEPFWASNVIGIGIIQACRGGYLHGVGICDYFAAFKVFLPLATLYVKLAEFMKRGFIEDIPELFVYQKLPDRPSFVRVTKLKGYRTTEAGQAFVDNIPNGFFARMKYLKKPK